MIHAQLKTIKYRSLLIYSHNYSTAYSECVFIDISILSKMLILLENQKQQTNWIFLVL